MKATELHPLMISFICKKIEQTLFDEDANHYIMVHERDKIIDFLNQEMGLWIPTPALPKGGSGERGWDIFLQTTPTPPLEKEGKKLAGFGKGGEEVCWLWKRRGGSLLALEKERRKLAGFGKGGEEVCWLWKRRGGSLLALEKERRKLAGFGKGGEKITLEKEGFTLMLSNKDGNIILFL